jgi:hypothetical protein
MLRRSVVLFAALCLSSLAQAITLPAPVLTVETGSTVTFAWKAPTANKDNSAITGTLTYNVYGVTATGSSSLQTGITGTTNQRTNLAAGTSCYAFTAVENGIESAQTAPVCVAAVAGPNPPTSITVTVTLTATSP